MPLLAIADAAGGEWPRRARGGLLTLFGHRAAEEGGAETGTLLLADLRDIFAEKGAERLPSEALCIALADMEHRPWPEWKQGKPMTAVQLAKALKPFGMKPTNIRTADGRVPKGYYRDHFGEAWSRYLPRDVSSLPSPPLPDRYSRYSVDGEGVVAEKNPLQATRPVAAPNGRIHIKNTDVAGVAGPHPPATRERVVDGFGDGPGAWEATL